MTRFLARGHQLAGTFFTWRYHPVANMKSGQTYRIELLAALEIVQKCLASFVTKSMLSRYGDEWLESFNKRTDRQYSTLGIGELADIILSDLKLQNGAFLNGPLANPSGTNLIYRIRALRNELHHGAEFTPERAASELQPISDLLRLLDFDKESKLIKDGHMSILRQIVLEKPNDIPVQHSTEPPLRDEKSDTQSGTNQLDTNYQVDTLDDDRRSVEVAKVASSSPPMRPAKYEDDHSGLVWLIGTVLVLALIISVGYPLLEAHVISQAERTSIQKYVEGRKKALAGAALQPGKAVTSTDSELNKYCSALVSTCVKDRGCVIQLFEGSSVKLSPGLMLVPDSFVKRVDKKLAGRWIAWHLVRDYRMRSTDLSKLSVQLDSDKAMLGIKKANFSEAKEFGFKN